jgi:hypothetical protein
MLETDYEEVACSLLETGSNACLIVLRISMIFYNIPSLLHSGRAATQNTEVDTKQNKSKKKKIQID